MNCEYESSVNKKCTVTPLQLLILTLLVDTIQFKQ